MATKQFDVSGARPSTLAKFKLNDNTQVWNCGQVDH